METKELKEIAELTFGKNSSRMTKEEQENIYNVDSLRQDLNYLGEIKPSKQVGTPTTFNEGDLALRLINPQAAVVSPTTAGSILSLNFAKIVPNRTKVDEWYLCYYLNEAEDVQKQIELSAQGQVSTIKRLGAKFLRELKIVLPDLEKQKELGQIYRNWLIYRHKTEEALVQQEELVFNAIAKECTND